MGGDCLNVGCVPSKCIIRSARAAASLQGAEDLGVKGDRPQVDFPAVMARMRRLRAKISPNDSAERFQKLGVDVFLGEGRFCRRANLAGGRKCALRFKKAVIATGAQEPLQPCDRWHRNRRLPDQRDCLFFDRSPSAASGHWRRSDRLRTGSSISAARQSGGAVSQKCPVAQQRRCLKPPRFCGSPCFKMAFAFGAKCRLAAGRVRRFEGKSNLLFKAAGEAKEQAIAVDEILIGAGRARLTLRG